MKNKQFYAYNLLFRCLSEKSNLPIYERDEISRKGVRVCVNVVNVPATPLGGAFLISYSARINMSIGGLRERTQGRSSY